MAIALIILSVLVSAITIDDIDKQFNQSLNNNAVFGASIALWQGNKIIFNNAYGTANLRKGIQMDPHKKMRIASISKTFATIGFMRLVERKQVDLDSDASIYLGFTLRNPNYPNDIITPRMLLSHTSSINDGEKYGDFLTDTYNANPVPHVSELATPTGKYYTQDMFLGKKPNTYFTYCNFNFGLIGTIIERITGIRFDIYMRENVLTPMSMESSYNVEDFETTNDIAAIYRFESGQWEAQTDDFGTSFPKRNLANYVIGTNGALFGPQGSLRASAKDIASFFTMIYNQGYYGDYQILTPESVKLMTTLKWEYDGTNGDPADFAYNYALGSFKPNGKPEKNRVFPGSVAYGHIGDAYGLKSTLFLDVTWGYGISVILNGAKSYDPSSTIFDKQTDDLIKIANTYFAQVSNPFISEAQFANYISLNRNSLSMFYWLLKCSDDSVIDPPLILWLQGNAGESGLVDGLLENGPFVVRNDGSVSKNIYSWNLKADIIFIDQPSCVGFSWCSNVETPLYSTTVAKDIYTLLAGIKTKFPEYGNRRFYIGGNGYAAHTVLATANYLLEKSIQVSGIAVGNGWFDFKYQSIKNTQFLKDSNKINEFTSLSATASFTLSSILYSMGMSTASLHYFKIGNAVSTKLSTLFCPFDISKTKDCYQSELTALSTFVNAKQVYDALHIVDSKVWSAFNKAVTSSLYYDQLTSVMPNLAAILEKGVKVIAFNGNLNYECSTLGIENVLSNVEWNGKEQFNAVQWKSYFIMGDVKGRIKSYWPLSLIEIDSSGLPLLDNKLASFDILDRWIS